MRPYVADALKIDSHHLYFFYVHELGVLPAHVSAIVVGWFGARVVCGGRRARHWVRVGRGGRGELSRAAVQFCRGLGSGVDWQPASVGDDSVALLGGNSALRHGFRD